MIQESSERQLIHRCGGGTVVITLHQVGIVLLSGVLLFITGDFRVLLVIFFRDHAYRFAKLLVVPPIDAVARLEEAADDVLAGCIFDPEPPCRLDLTHAFLEHHLAEAFSDVVWDHCIGAAFEFIRAAGAILFAI